MCDIYLDCRYTYVQIILLWKFENSLEQQPQHQHLAAHSSCSILVPLEARTKQKNRQEAVHIHCLGNLNHLRTTSTPASKKRRRYCERIHATTIICRRWQIRLNVLKLPNGSSITRMTFNSINDTTTYAHRILISG